MRKAIAPIILTGLSTMLLVFAWASPGLVLAEEDRDWTATLGDRLDELIQKLDDSTAADPDAFTQVVEPGLTWAERATERENATGASRVVGTLKKWILAAPDTVFDRKLARDRPYGEKFRALARIGRWARRPAVRNAALVDEMTQVLASKSAPLEAPDQLTMASLLRDVGSPKALAAAVSIATRLRPGSNPRLSADQVVVAAGILHAGGVGRAKVQPILDTIPIGLLEAMDFDYYLLNAQIAVTQEAKGTQYYTAGLHAHDDEQLARLLEAISHEKITPGVTWPSKVVLGVIRWTKAEALLVPGFGKRWADAATLIEFRIRTVDGRQADEIAVALIGKIGDSADRSRRALNPQ